MNALAQFPFSDLDSFKDYVVFVRMCAPDRFPIREGLGPSDQWSLALAFEGLRQGLSYLTDRPTTLGECQCLVEEAFAFYSVGDKKSGFYRLEEMRTLLARIRTE